MARTMGPEELMVVHGDHHLRANELADATSTYISGMRNGGDAGALNAARIGLVLVARIDEETSFAARALDSAQEHHALLRARDAQRRAEVAFAKSLKDDSSSSNSAIAHFGSAECLVEEAMYRAKQPLKTGHLSKKKAAAAVAAKNEAVDKLHRQATRRYAAAYLRDPEVNRAYDRLLPKHLDSEASRTLPLVHARNLTSNQAAADEYVRQAAAEAHHLQDLDDTTTGDGWSKRVRQKPPPNAAVGQYDSSGDHAEAELAAFKKAHDRRMAAAYKPGELKQARAWIESGLKQHRIKHADSSGRRG